MFNKLTNKGKKKLPFVKRKCKAKEYYCNYINDILILIFYQLKNLLTEDYNTGEK